MPLNSRPQAVSSIASNADSLVEEVGGGGQLGRELMVGPELSILEETADAGVILGELDFEAVELRKVIVDTAFEGGFVSRELVDRGVRELRRDWREIVGRKWHMSRQRRQLGGTVALAGAEEATETWTVC